MSTGGPAFPQHGWSKDPQVLERMRNQGGMTLLDWFAGQALAGLVSESGRYDAAGAALDAYDLAAAMLAEKARREAVVKESSTTDHSPDAGKMIPDPFAEDALRQLASDVLPADIKDAASEERLTWCAEQVRAQVNTLEARNRELVERIKRLEEVTQERDKEWFQVIESILGFHPVSMTEALHIGIERIKKQKQRIKQLEDAGDKMAELLDCYGGFNETEEWACSTRSQHIRETRLATDAWAKAKGQP